MKTRILILIAVSAVLVVWGVALATAGASNPNTAYTLPQAALAGTGYRMTSVTCQAIGAAEGGRYHLVGPASPRLTGNGCCCGFIPLILR